MRRLFCITNGRSNDFISKVISTFNRPKRDSQQHSNGVLGDLSAEELDRITSEIDTFGFHVFKNKLAAEAVDALVEFAENCPCSALLEHDQPELRFNYSSDMRPYRDHQKSVKYNFMAQDILQLTQVQDLTVDASILRVAENYLKSAPILDLLAMWWSRPSSKPSSEAAQIYHFDMDRIKFLKFFFYLTDVSGGNGPHCYVSGSCKRKPEALCRDGRILDEEMTKNFNSADFVEICGDRGTIIAVDTRGFHKGKPLDYGERLILQFEFSNSMFGSNYKKLKTDCMSESFRKTISLNKRFFGLIEQQ